MKNNIICTIVTLLFQTQLNYLNKLKDAQFMVRGRNEIYVSLKCMKIIQGALLVRLKIDDFNLEFEEETNYVTR